MSKTLHLIRHAKSSWKNPELTDIERPLNKRGKRECQLMAKPIAESGCRFEYVFCSPAKRARKTIKRIYKALDNVAPAWQIDAALYAFNYEDLLNWCRQLDDALESVLIVGHNPALTDLCQYLVSNVEVDNIPTCAYVRLELACNNWASIDKNCARLVQFVKPKDFL